MTINELVDKLDQLTKLQAGATTHTQKRLLVEISPGRWALVPRAHHLALADDPLPGQ